MPCEVMDVSIVIVSYNTLSILRDCITSIKDKTRDVDYEIIVVDNASSDGTVDMLHREFPDVVVIESGGNLGFGRANNIGMQHASGKYVFLLNSDTLLVNNAVLEFYRKAEEFISAGHKVGVMGSILLDADLKTIHSYGRFITPLSELREVVSKYLRFLKDKENLNPPAVAGEMRMVDYVTGADMFIPADVYRATSGFDPDYFMYCEEVDWQKRMASAGYERMVVRGPEIIHLEGGSDKTKKSLWSPSRLKNLYKSRKIYRKKHYNRSLLPFFRALYFILDMPSVVLTALLTRQKEYLRLINLK